MEHTHHNLLAAHTQPRLNVVVTLFLGKLKQLVDENLDNSRLNAGLAEKAMGISKSTLNRRLKAIVNMTISEFIKQYRLQRSAELLRDGYKVKEVSRQTGFNTPSYFAFCFKARYHQTPSDYRKSFG